MPQLVLRFLRSALTVRGVDNALMRLLQLAGLSSCSLMRMTRAFNSSLLGSGLSNHANDSRHRWIVRGETLLMN